MAEELNRFFGFVFTREDTNNLQDVLVAKGTRIMDELKEIYIRRETVLDKLLGLKADKSPGPAGLHPGYLWRWL